MAEEVGRFYALDQQLRERYRLFVARYPGAALTGLLIQGQRLGEQSFFRHNPKSLADL